MTGHCKDCKWWDRYGKPDAARQWGLCEGVDSECVDSMHENDIGSIDAGGAIVTLAGDSYGAGAGFRTGPMFGCVLFEPRDDG